MQGPLTSQLPTCPCDFSDWERSHNCCGFTEQKEGEDSQCTFSSRAPGDWDPWKLSTKPHHVPCTMLLGLSSSQQVSPYPCQEQDISAPILVSEAVWGHLGPPSFVKSGKISSSEPQCPLLVNFCELSFGPSGSLLGWCKSAVTLKYFMTVDSTFFLTLFLFIRILWLVSFFLVHVFMCVSRQSLD